MSLVKGHLQEFLLFSQLCHSHVHNFSVIYPLQKQCKRWVGEWAMNMLKFYNKKIVFKNKK